MLNRPTNQNLNYSAAPHGYKPSERFNLKPSPAGEGGSSKTIVYKGFDETDEVSPVGFFNDIIINSLPLLIHHFVVPLLPQEKALKSA